MRPPNFVLDQNFSSNQKLFASLSVSLTLLCRATRVGTRLRSPGIKKELKDCVHDKDGRCGTYGEGANKVFEPQWVNGVYRKKWVWRCNVLAMKTEQKLKQTKISFFVRSDSGEAVGRGDTKMQLAAGRASTMANASNTENFDNVTGQSTCDVQPGMSCGTPGRSDLGA